jgi:hypothetical protein
LPINKYESSLYFGFQPSWKDILEEWDFRNPQVMAQLTDFLTYVDVKKSGIFSLYGKGLSGKSTFLLRIGNELQLQGYDVWQFKGKYFNYFEFFKWIKHNSDIKLWALIIDDASYNYGNVKRLINLIPSGQQLIVVSTSRIPSHIKLRYNFIDTIHKEFYIEPLIDNDYASAIEEKLDNKGYLGTLKNYTYRAERVRHIAQQNDILTVLYDITYGQGFINRLKSDLNPLLKKDDSATDFLMILAIFERLDLPNVPRELIYLLYGKESAKILQNVDNFVRYTNQGDISLRTSFYLTSILKNSQKGKIISLIKNVLIAISPQIDDNPRNQWNQIEASCTKERTLRSKFSLSIDEIKNMLYELKGELGVSYNYWIQLGIAEQITKDFDKALNHFKQAEALNPGSYMVQNSIGRNYLRQANSSAKASEAKRFFSEGEEILLKLINNREEHQVRAFSTHTYLYEKINYLKKFKMKVSNEELRKMFFLLKNLMDKDPDDTMAKHISNVFLSFLRSINRTNIIRLNYHNISLLKNLLQENDMEIDDLLIV